MKQQPPQPNLVNMDKIQEKAEELSLMKKHIEHSLGNSETREKVTADFIYTFEQLGLSHEQATQLCSDIFTLLLSNKPLADIENQSLRMLENIKLKVNDRELNLIEVLHEKLKDRAKIIASQVEPYLQDVKGKVIDYGTGDGQVAQMLHDHLGLNIEGVDVRLYKAPNVTIPVMSFNGGNVPVANETYEAAMLTNVLHHEKINEKIINELDRIVQHKLVILETVPIGETEETMTQDKDRTFMNDYLYNRLFHSADVPVPGTFETPQKWIERFTKHGWKLAHEEDFGFDQPTIKDRHYLLVFEK